MQKSEVKNEIGEWIIIRLITKCPKCGREYGSKGEFAKSELDASYVECSGCGFKGVIHQ